MLSVCKYGLWFTVLNDDVSLTCGNTNALYFNNHSINSIPTEKAEKDTWKKADNNTLSVLNVNIINEKKF